MKKAIAIIGICMAGTALRAGPRRAVVQKGNQVTIRLLDRSHEAQVVETRYVLRQTERGFRCGSESIPDHPMLISGLSLKTPFPSSRVPSSCQRVLEWGGSRQCYSPGADRLVDDLLFACASL